MVAYSFKKQFCDPIVEGTKTCTIRGDRKRHAQVSEPVQLYFGMRTKYCRKLLDPEPICIGVHSIRIRISRYFEPAAVLCSALRLKGYVTDDFARMDGFESIDKFTQYWFDNEGTGYHDRTVILWNPNTRFINGDPMPYVGGQTCQTASIA